MGKSGFDRTEIKRQRKFFRMTDTKAFYILIFPFISMVLLIRLVPFLWGLNMSFTNFSGFNPHFYQHVGLDNYIAAFTRDVRLPYAIPSTIAIAAFSVPITLSVGLLLALLLNQNVKGDGFFRTVYYIPSIIPGVVAVLMWRILLNPNGGLVNMVIDFFRDTSASPIPLAVMTDFFVDMGDRVSTLTMLDFFQQFRGEYYYVDYIVSYFSNPEVYLSAETITNYFRPITEHQPINWFGFQHIRHSLFFILAWTAGAGVLTYLAALKNVPQELYESAAIDGANSWLRFYKITFPMLTPVIFFNLINGFIAAFQIFGQPLMLAGFGGGGILSAVPLMPIYTYVVHIFQEVFTFRRFGYGLALTWMLFFGSIIVTRVVFWSSKFWVFYEADAKAVKKKKKRRLVENAKMEKGAAVNG